MNIEGPLAEFEVWEVARCERQDASGRVVAVFRYVRSTRSHRIRCCQSDIAKLGSEHKRLPEGFSQGEGGIRDSARHWQMVRTCKELPIQVDNVYSKLSIATLVTISTAPRLTAGIWRLETKQKLDTQLL